MPNTKTYMVKLTKIRSDHQNLRTDEIKGATLTLPEKGKSFQLFGEGLEFGTRVVTTTEIQVVDKIGNEYEFSTLNSTYKLEVLDEFKEETEAPSE